MSMIQPCIEKIFINLNTPLSFNLRQKILGDQNTNLQFIVNETKANVSLRGRGSGFIEPSLGMESSEPLHLYIEHPNLKNLIEAKNLARNLLETIQQDLQVFIQSNPSAQAIPMQQPPPIANNQPITLPSTAVLSIPPPNIIQNNNIQPATHIIQQSNFLPQSQILPQQMQIIQNIPPPTGIPIRAAGTAAAPISVQFQGQPTNIQIQPATNQQILLNQSPAQQYQLQYIPAPTAFIQPQQQLQSILQPNGQHFITVQGNTAFMLPPPSAAPTATIQSPPNIGMAQFNAAPPAHSVEDIVKAKQSEEKGNSSGIATSTRLNINQPPPSIQQFILANNAWPQAQQMPINSQQIQIVTQQPPPSAIPAVSASGQQVIAAFNPHQGPPIQQLQFSNQPIITQPPPSTLQIQEQQQSATVSRQMNPSLSYQQQFEQKIHMINEGQQRAVKRKMDELESDSNKSFPKSGMGSMTKNRPPPPIQQHLQSKINSPNNRVMMAKGSSSSAIASTSGENFAINSNNKSMFSKNTNPTQLNASQGDSKSMKGKKENEYSEASPLQPPPQPIIMQHGYVDMQNQFMQPPPSMHFNQTRAQMMVPPPTIQLQHQDSAQGGGSNNHFIQQVNINRYASPRGNFQQHTRFRPQWQ